MNLDFERLSQEIRSGKDIKLPGEIVAWLAKPKKLWIGGEWVEGESSFSTLGPATGEVLSEIHAAGREQIDRAVRAAEEAYRKGTWSRLPMGERADWLRRIADVLDRHRPVLAILESLDTGKPVRESFEGDIARAALNFRFFADLAITDGGEAFSSSEVLHYSFREPLGVVALITPWNLPLYLETWKIAPCLLMGNSCILKPSELTPLTACYFAELLEQIDFPRGVFNLVQGFGGGAAGEFLVSHAGVKAISFTGETVTGTAIMKSAATHLAKVSFELGGKGASVVFADADLDEALEQSVRAAFRNQGEICLACPRLFVEETVYENFLEKFVNRVNRIRVGNPLNYTTEMGALIGQEHYEKVSSYLQTLQAPARVHCGGGRPTGLSTEFSKGYFLSPTVVDCLPDDHPALRKEVFGPLLTVVPFKTEAEVVAKVNDTPYGLSAAVWTTHTDRAYRVSRAIHSGLVWIKLLVRAGSAGSLRGPEGQRHWP